MRGSETMIDLSLCAYVEMTKRVAPACLGVRGRARPRW